MTATDDEPQRAPVAPRARPGLRCFLAAVGGAAATGLVTPPAGLSWLQWPALVLCLRALEGQGLRRAALIGFAMGLGINVSLFTWLGVATARLGHLPWPAALGLFVAWAAFASLQFALVGVLDAAVATRWPAARRALVPCAFVACETLWPSVIPWTMGLGQLPCLPLAQVAELGGAPLLTFVVLCGAAGLDAGLAVLASLKARRSPARRDLVDLAWCALVVVGALAFGLARLAALEAPPPRRARVAIVQPGVASNSMTPLTPAEVQAALERVAREVGRAGGVELAVFPEAAAARRLIELAHADAPAPVVAAIEAEARRAREELARLARLCGSPTLVGLTAVRVAPGETIETSRVVERRNAAVLLDAAGAIVDRYDKHRLLVVAERLPGEEALPWLRSLLPFAGRFSPGPGPRTLEAGTLRVAPLICFEAVPSGPTRVAVAASPGGVDLLANLTNDVWFPGQGPHLHALAASLRAIEARRALVRSTTTGLSFAVLPDGRRIGEAPPRAPSVQIVDLPLRGGTTPYVDVGYALEWSLTVASLFAAAASRVIRPGGARQADRQCP